MASTTSAGSPEAAAFGADDPCRAANSLPERTISEARSALLRNAAREAVPRAAGESALARSSAVWTMRRVRSQRPQLLVPDDALQRRHLRLQPVLHIVPPVETRVLRAGREDRLRPAPDLVVSLRCGSSRSSAGAPRPSRPRSSADGRASPSPRPGAAARGTTDRADGLRPLDELDDLLEQVGSATGDPPSGPTARRPLADGLPALLRLHHHRPGAERLDVVRGSRHVGPPGRVNPVSLRARPARTPNASRESTSLPGARRASARGARTGPIRSSASSSGSEGSRSSRGADRAGHRVPAGPPRALGRRGPPLGAGPPFERLDRLPDALREPVRRGSRLARGVECDRDRWAEDLGGPVLLAGRDPLDDQREAARGADRAREVERQPRFAQPALRRARARRGPARRTKPAAPRTRSRGGAPQPRVAFASGFFGAVPAGGASAVEPAPRRSG